MGITNPANEGSKRNVHNLYSLNGVLITNTGNMNKKNVFNNTYTLDSKTTNAQLANYYDCIGVLGENILGTSLNAGQAYYIFGHPNKFYYDYLQEKNNCGVVSSLNILAMAGIKNISQLSYADMVNNEKIKAEIKKAQENGEFYMGPQPVSRANTELAFTLWAIQNSKNDLSYYYDNHDFKQQTNPDGSQSTSLGYYDSKEIDNIDDSFCVHNYDYTHYKNTGNILYEDGGTYIWHQENILDYHKVESKIDTISLELVPANEPEQITIELEPLADQIILSKKDNHEFLFIDGTPGETITGQKIDPPNHYTIDINLSKSDVLNQRYAWIRDDENAIIQFDDNTSLTIEGYYSEEYDITYGITFLKEGTLSNEKAETISLSEFEFECMENKKLVFKDSNRYKFEFVYDLEHYFYEGKGLILSGDAGFLAGSSPEGGHAISVVGIVLENGEKIDFYSDNDGEMEITYSYSINDVTGFMVVDTGGWLGLEGFMEESAQFISVEKMYEFMTGGEYTDDLKGIRIGYNFISTEDEIRSWADDLNLIGNNMKNLLIGNDGKNTIKGKGGSDNIKGGHDNDILYGDSGHDVIWGNSGNDTIYGGSGDDKYIFQADDVVDKNGNFVANHDVIDVGTGRDELEFNDMSSSVTLNKTIIYKKYEYIKDSFQYYNKNGDLLITYDIEVTSETKDLDTEITKTTISKIEDNSILVLGYFSKSKFNVLKSIKFGDNFDITENLDFIKDILSKGKIIYTPNYDQPNNMLGTKYNDNITGGHYGDTIKAGEDSDTINGGAGNDLIYAGKGVDTIYGSHGNDTIYTDSGQTTLIYKVGEYSGSDVINPGKGVDYIILQDDGTLNLSKDKMLYSRNKKDLVITYHEDSGSSITIKNYFSKKGKTSIKSIFIESTNETIELIPEYESILEKATATESTGNKGNNNIKVTTEGTSIFGGLGNDTINGSKGDDTISGGLNNDKLYGKGGTNTYLFEGHAFGNDTIYTTSKSETILDFTDSGINFDKNGISSEDKFANYAYTKDKNNLIINYATDVKENGNAQITINNFFKSKDVFTLIGADNNALNLKEATIYIEGKLSTSNKLTGSNYNDRIIGQEKNDTIKALKGNDTIIAGQGDDNITGGAGDNTINYSIGDGLDTINLTKTENLMLNIENAISINNFDYRIEKGNLIINYTNEYNETEDLINLKNFGKKDITGVDGSVKLNINKAIEIDLKNDIFLPAYQDFTIKNYKYKGSWLSEKIDASVLNDQLITKNRGANITAGAGNDSIIGSHYSDTIKGGDGDDIIITNQTQNNGKNTIDGGKGSDKYKLFYDREHGEDGSQITYEITNIKDTGKTEGDIDRVYLNLNKEEISIAETQHISQAGKLWFNVTAKGKVTNTINISTFDGKNVATLTNIEEIYTKDNYLYKMDSVIDEVREYLIAKNIKDVATLMKNSDYPTMQKEILEIFAKGWVASTGLVYTGTEDGDLIKEYGITGIDTINGLGGDDTISAGDKILIVNAGDGDDIITGKSTESVQKLYGEAGNDKISAGEYGAELYGGEGNDTLIGGYRNDLIIGGKGDDIIYGSGKDSIVINANDGNDTYLYGSGKDTINLKDVSFADLTMTKEGNDLIITSNTDSLKIAYTYSNEAIIGNLTFEDSTGDSLTLEELLNSSIINYEATNSDDTIIAPSFGNYLINTKDGNDYIESSFGRDTITAGLGKDTILGSGNDLIIFNENDGQDDVYTTFGDTLSFEDVAFNDMTLLKENNDLIISSNGGDDVVKIKNAFNGTIINNNGLIIDSSNTTKSYKDLINENVIYVNGTYGNDTLTAGREGNYEMSGGNGNDTYNIYDLSSRIIIQDENGTDKIIISNEEKDNISIFINVDKNGKVVEGNDSLTITKDNGESGIIINGHETIENITIKDELYIQKEQINELKANIATWLTDNGIETANDVLSSGTEEQKEALLAIYNQINWQSA